MDRVTLAIITLCVICTAAGYAAHSQVYYSYAENTHSANQSGIRFSTRSRQDPGSADEKTGSQSSPRYATPEWSNWALVGVGVITFVVIGWQAWETRRAAEAANKSAQAFITSERAWIIPELIPMARQISTQGWARRTGNGWAVMSPEEVLRGDNLKHRLKFINMGRTAGVISRYEVHYGLYEWKTETLRIEGISQNGEFEQTLGGSESIDTDEIAQINDFIKDPADAVGPPHWENWMIVLVSLDYTHVFNAGNFEHALFRFVLNVNNWTMERKPTTQADIQQDRERKIYPPN